MLAIAYERPSYVGRLAQYVTESAYVRVVWSTTKVPEPPQTSLSQSRCNGVTWVSVAMLSE